MKAIITGMHGTVAPVLADRLQREGITVSAWDRARVPTDDETAMARFLAEEAPQWFFHVATGSPDWAGRVAALCAREHIAFLFTSSVSVFDGAKDGPYDLDRTPDAQGDYGRYKFACEQVVREANPQALIARLGWQIGDAAGSNNMVDFLERQMAEQGRIEASSAWYPSCAFLPDTAEALHALMQQATPGLYQLEGNPGCTFLQIVNGLNALRGNAWTVVPGERPAQNNRMLDDRVVVRPITERLPG